jgi:hypothetical protein
MIARMPIIQSSCLMRATSTAIHVILMAMVTQGSFKLLVLIKVLMPLLSSFQSGFDLVITGFLVKLGLMDHGMLTSLMTHWCWEELKLSAN